MRSSEPKIVPPEEAGEPRLATLGYAWLTVILAFAFCLTTLFGVARDCPSKGG